MVTFFSFKMIMLVLDQFFFMFSSLLALDEPISSEKNRRVVNEVQNFAIPFIHSTTWELNVKNLKVSDSQIVEAIAKKLGNLYRNKKSEKAKGIAKYVFNYFLNTISLTHIY